MGKYPLESHRKLIENIRLICIFAIGFFAVSYLLQGIIIALILGLVDHFFIQPKLKPREKRKFKN